MSQSKLNTLRKKIDMLDRETVGNINKRAAYALEIGRLKVKANKSVYSPDREQGVYERVVSANKGPFADKSIRAVYREIMSGVLSLQAPMKVAYLGPPATFTNIATIKKFGESIMHVPVKSITDVFTEVSKGRCDHGVIPIENSTEGAVTHALDMFIDSDIKICNEIMLSISHNLLSKARMDSIKQVFSNPQVFGQCRMWLEANLPGADLVEVSSTTRAAEMAREKKNTAAIASLLAARQYGLKVLAPSIEDSSWNVTRLLVIGREWAGRTGDDKTSVLFSVKDKVGALHSMLYPFKKHRINLTKIESRPSKRKAWEYFFFVDMKGHVDDKKVKMALKALEKQCTQFKILGSYPFADDLVVQED